VTLKNTNDIDHDDFEQGFNVHTNDEDLSLLGRNYQSYMKYINILHLINPDGAVKKLEPIELKT
jgi:hypothetical protein